MAEGAEPPCHAPCATQPGDEGHVGMVQPKPALGCQEMMELNTPTTMATAFWVGAPSTLCPLVGVSAG